ncbi:MAG TPA: MBL fold metallo-hydrolase [Planctomycetota bacterium]|jgi:beta-lactamase superfamily II metal-dependent hydrolase|nr:MBL fold metallo-hydrolase [Planctomycetota bacterium]
MHGFPLALLVVLLAPAAAAQAPTLKIYFLDVGQGDSTLIVSPTGTSLLVDAGPEGEGTSTVVPFLLSHGVTTVNYALATHYHTDHIGGLDEVASALPGPTTCYDRGLASTPSTTAYANYASALAGARVSIAPGTTIPLGGGVTVTCTNVNGQIFGGPTVAVAGTSQEENSRSVGLKVEFGSFDFWIGGDTTGGGNSTADVETPLGSTIGNVEVIKASHHGSFTSSNAAFVAATQPDVSVFSCGLNNPYGHPSIDAIDNLNPVSKGTILFSTTGGTGNVGFVDAEGSVSLVTDGTTYTITPAVGAPLTLACDEVGGTAPAPGDLKVSEYMANPAAVADTAGEWFEIVNVQATPRWLRNVVFTADDGNTFTFYSGVRLGPGGRFVFGRDGDPTVNGGFTPSTVWPFGAYSFGDSTDSIVLRNPSLVIVDEVHYSTGAGFPAPSGASVERENLLGAAVGSNFSASTATFGAGDEGTPGGVNSADSTTFPAVAVPSAPVTPGSTLAISLVSLSDAGRFYVAALSLGTAPGFFLGSVLVPINADGLAILTAGLPGWSGVLLSPGLGSCSIPVPADPALVGFTAYGAFVVLQPPAMSAVRASAAATITVS